MAVSKTHNGWLFDPVNSRLNFYYRGTRIGHINATQFVVALAMDVVGATTTAAIVASGQISNTAGDIRSAAGNLRLGTVSAFGTTEPTAWAVFRSATQPAGAITTAGGVGANDTTVQKIVAGGTVNNVET